jgi:hemolysin activation/secretion protein
MLKGCSQRALLVVGLCCVLITTGARAQQVSPQSIPPIAEPSAPQRQQTTLPERRPSSASVPVPQGYADAPVPPGADATFVLRKIELEGVTAYPVDELLSPYKRSIGREISVAQVFEIAGGITARYRKDGWVYSRVLVPAQEITSGVVVLRAIEGFVTEVEFSGDRGRRTAFEESIRRKLTRQKPLRQQSLERYLLLLNDAPGASATTSLSPAQSEIGGFRLNTHIEQDRFDFTAGASNRGSRVLGPEQYDVSLALNSLLGGYDSTRFSYVTTGSNQELEYYAVSQSWLLSSNGTKLDIGASRSESQPDLGIDFESLNLETSSKSYSLTLSHPLVRSRRSNLAMRLVAAYHEGETRDAFQTSRLDKIPTVRLGFTFDTIDVLNGVNVLDLQFSRGIDAGDVTTEDSPDSSRPGASAEAAKAEIYAARLQSFGSRLSALFALQGQYAAGDLLSSEEFAFGGPLFGRAYDPSELVGDSGVAGKFELRYSIAGNAASPFATVYAFYDAGIVYRRNAQPGEKSKDSAVATGLGARFNVGEHVHGYVEGALPLTQSVAAENNDDPRVFAGVSFSF